jgi:iron complex outermembrane receptor protein
MHCAFLRRAAAAVAILFAAAGTAWAAPADPEAPPITGIVTDTAGTPLANARVAVSGANRATTTGADGTFVLRSVPAGRYHLDVSRIGYAPEHVEVTVPETGSPVFVEIVLIPTPLALEGVIVTGTPGASDPLTVTQSTTQISGKEFDRQVGATIAETLAEEPGIQTRFAGPAASLPVIRGLTGDRILILQNGQRTGDLSGSSADHALSIDPLSATRIEVVRGPASLLYGSSALGGVVNVIGTDIPTNVPTHIEGYVAAQGATVTPGGAATAEAVFPVGSSLALSARGGFRNMGDLRVGGDAVLENTSLETVHGDVGFGYIGERLSGGLAFNGHAFEYGLPLGLHEEEIHAGEEPLEEEAEGIRLDGSRFELTGRSDWALGGAVFQELNANGTAQWYQHDEIEPTGEIGTTFRLNTQTLDLKANTDFWNARGTVGLSGLFKQYDPTGEEALTPPANSRDLGIFLFQEMPLFGGDHETEYVPHLQLGARYDRFWIDSEAGGEKFGPARSLDFDALTGSVGVLLPFRERTSVGVSVARAFRAPTVEELFSNAFHAAVGAFDVGNPELEPETNLGAEGVFRSQTTRLNVLFSAYYNRIDNFITPTIVGDTLLVENGEVESVPLNVFGQGDATLKGLEGKVEALVAPNWVLGVRGDVVEGEFTDGGPLPFMPAGHLGGDVRWDNGNIAAGTNIRHAFAQDEVSENELATGAYTLFGLNLSYTRNLGGQIHTVTLQADNLLDERYREATSRIKAFAPNPGRNLSLVYRVLF